MSARYKVSELKKMGYRLQPPKKKNKPKKFWRIFFTFCLAGLIVLVAAAVYLFYLYKTLPNPSSIGERIVNQSTKIYDRTGQNLLYEIHGEERRTVIPLQEIPDYAREAMIVIEDAEFYQHPAFDWRGIIRALIVNLQHGSIVQGGSTITQQLVKNAFLSDEKTVQRKLKEIILAIKLEKNYSKDQILELYLNQIPYGSNAYGIEAASQAFFSKDAKDLTLAEAALLAALPQAPSYYSPYGNHQKELLARKNYILERMKQYGYIDEEEFQRAIKESINFSPKFEGMRAPHFVMFIKEYLESKYGADYVETAGLNVTTTLDWNLQQAAETAVSEGAKRNEELYKGKNAALIAQDPKTGQILAMVGSRDYFDIANEGNFNVVTGHRQPGSAFKPFAYLAAFQKGYTPDTIVFDLKTEFNPDCPASADQEKDPFGLDCYHPANYDQRFRGPVDFRHGLAQSINVPSVKVLYLTGLKDTIQTAQKFGITTLTETGRYGLSLVLGGGDVRPIDMAEAYSVFAQDGQKHEQTAILKVEDAQGRVLEKYEDKSEEVYNPQYIRMVNDILSDNEARLGLFSPNNLLEIPGYEVAAKTGTTQDYRDAWVAGYTPSLVVVVWAGNNDFSPMQRGAAGILAAVPIWHNFMVEALKNQPAEAFPQPTAANTDKPILNGQYLSYFKVADKLYPQIHDILFWVDKNNPQGPLPEHPENDPQFENWEKPVLEWIKSNLANPGQYNEPVPPDYAEIVGAKQAPEITIINPTNGAYLQNPTIQFQAQIKSSFGIKSIKLYFNKTLVNETQSLQGENYQFNFTPSTIEPQNQIKIEARDSFDNLAETSVIVFKP
jgi:1A family penicillin-binding protein